MVHLQPVRIPPARAFWLQEALSLEPDAEAVQPLEGAHTVDVCIVGGGYTGLWTALRLKELAPATEVVVLEADICGGGASGRNGGLVNAWWARLPALIKLCGTGEARFLASACSSAVGEIGRLCSEHNIEAHFNQKGWLHTATTPLQIGKWDEAIAAAERLGFDAYQRLAPDEVQRRGGSPVYAGGVLEKDAGTVQPALLARGMRRVALAKGVRIYEKTPVTELHPGSPPMLRTPRAAIIARKVVLATNAWTASLPELKRHLIVVSTDMIATAPIPERLAEIGWTGGESITDSRLMVHYYHVTHDKRIAIGRGSGALAYSNRQTARFDGSPAKAAVVERGLHKFYPTLRNVPITHRWGGPIDRSRSGTLVFGKLGGNPDIVYGVGYSGTGVAPSVVGGKILASTVLERDDDWSRTRLNQGPVILYPPEPIKFFAGIGVRAVLTRKEEGEEDGIKPNAVTRWVASLADPRLPRGLDRSKGEQHR